jgi:uncharacterized protein YabE (DUF348 family)
LFPGTQTISVKVANGSKKNALKIVYKNGTEVSRIIVTSVPYICSMTEVIAKG